MSQDFISFDIDKAKISEAAIRKELENLDDIISQFQDAVNESSTWWTGGSHTVFMRLANEFIAQKSKIEEEITTMADGMANAIRYKTEQEKAECDFINAQLSTMSLPDNKFAAMGNDIQFCAVTMQADTGSNGKLRSPNSGELSDSKGNKDKTPNAAAGTEKIRLASNIMPAWDTVGGPQSKILDPFSSIGKHSLLAEDMDQMAVANGVFSSGGKQIVEKSNATENVYVRTAPAPSAPVADIPSDQDKILMKILVNPSVSAYQVPGLGEAALDFLERNMNKRGGILNLPAISACDENELEALAIIGAIRKITGMHGEAIYNDPAFAAGIENVASVYNYRQSEWNIIDRGMLDCFKKMYCDIKTKAASEKWSAAKCNEENIELFAALAQYVNLTEYMLICYLSSLKSSYLDNESGTSPGYANGGTGSKIEINTVDDLFDNPKALSNATPEEWYDYLQKNGYNPQPLGSKSSLNGVSFDQGGGFRINWGGDRYLQYHPSTASHHGGAYWKLSSGPTGAIRIDMNGNIIH